jgi:hypothetical protein
VPPEQRIAIFDQDGTLWVEHPVYSQIVYCLDRVPALAEKDPKLKEVEPFKTVLSGNREAIAKLSLHDLEKILFATLTGMSVDDFEAEVKRWLASAKADAGSGPILTSSTNQCSKSCSICAATGSGPTLFTGGGQDFVRVYSERAYGIPPEQLVDTVGGNKYGYQKDGAPFLTKEPKLLLNDDNALAEFE